MNLNAPTRPIFLISLLLAILALVGFFVPTIPVLGAHSFWFAVAAYFVLAAATTLKKV
ncbi:MAG: hypothetical protein KDK99_02185 [Verrucomicrobiales bacterium]|nr:hypothetical protein [Verrucomicrobiales bacterium]